MFRAKLQQLMYGRNGPDALGTAAIWISLAVWVVYLFTRLFPLYLLCLMLIGYALFRMFSRHVEKRRAENNAFLNAFRPLRRKYSAVTCRLRDREHRYFRCPNCGQQLRVPRGKGHIQVTCRSCGITFEEKS